MTEFYVRNGPLTLYCRCCGAGPTLLLIHGACTDSDFFQDTARFLSKRFRVVLYDRRGYGRSSEPEDHGHGIASQATDAYAVIRAVGNPCFVAAHSAGCAVALELASRHPELVQGMLLYEPVSMDTADTVRDRFCDDIRTLLAQNRRSRALLRFFMELEPLDTRARPQTEDEKKHVPRNSTCFLQYEIEPVYGYMELPELPENIPIYVGLGERSANTHRAKSVEYLAAKLPAQQLAFPGSHNCPFDLPWEFAWLTAGALLG